MAMWGYAVRTANDEYLEAARFRLAEGVDPGQFARDIEAFFIENGMEKTVLVGMIDQVLGPSASSWGQASWSESPPLALSAPGRWWSAANR